MESNTLFLDEVKKERLRLKKVKKIKITIKTLSIVLLLLIIYLVKEVMLWLKKEPKVTAKSTKGSLIL